MRLLSSLWLLPLALLLTACGGNRNEAMDNVEENANKLDMTDGELTPVALTPMPATYDFPNATIDDWSYANGTFTYRTSGYEFAAPTPDADALMCANSGKGQHAHLIIDNEPYIAKYEPTFEQAVADGEHHILTFLSRSYHESIKNGTAHRAWKVDVANGSFTSQTPITEPMLFYSRPKGTYRGKKETQNVMLDFFPVNVTLGDEYQVKAVVNGEEEFMVKDWKPMYLVGLPMGENTVELTLMRGDDVVDAPLNPVTRTFTLEELPTEE